MSSVAQNGGDPQRQHFPRIRHLTVLTGIIDVIASLDTEEVWIASCHPGRNGVLPELTRVSTIVVTVQRVSKGRNTNENFGRRVTIGMIEFHQREARSENERSRSSANARLLTLYSPITHHVKKTTSSDPPLKQITKAPNNCLFTTLRHTMIPSTTATTPSPTMPAPLESTTTFDLRTSLSNHPPRRGSRNSSSATFQHLGTAKLMPAGWVNPGNPKHHRSHSLLDGTPC